MKYIILILFAVYTATSFAQTKPNSKLVGNEYTQIVSKKSVASHDSTTNFTYKDKTGKIYPVYQSTRGSHYIWRPVTKGKNTGKPVKYYLKPE